jgi:hypothetical protein
MKIHRKSAATAPAHPSAAKAICWRRRPVSIAESLEPRRLFVDTGNTLAAALDVGALVDGQPYRNQDNVQGGTGDKYDWYKFTITQPGTVTETMTTEDSWPFVGMGTDLNNDGELDQWPPPQDTERPGNRLDAVLRRDVTPGTYYAYIHAYFDATDADYTFSLSFTAGGTALPYMVIDPAGFALTATPVSSTQIDLAWEDSSSPLVVIDQYNIGFSGEPPTRGGSYLTNPLASAGGGRRFQITGLSPDTGYTFRVVGYPNDSLSDYIFAKTLGGPPNVVPDPTPTGRISLTADNIPASGVLSTSYVDLHWVSTSAPSAAGYLVEQQIGSGRWKAAGIVTDTGGADTSAGVGFQVADLERGTNYRFRVTNLDNSILSNTFYVSTDGTPPPPTVNLKEPSNLTAIPVSGNQIDLTWQDNSDDEELFIVARLLDDTTIEGIEEFVSGGEGRGEFFGVFLWGVFGLIGTVDANVTSYSDTTLTRDTEYSYVVYSVGPSEGRTDVASATTLSTSPPPTPTPTPTRPTAPVALAAAASAPDQVTLNWTDTSDNEEHFEIQRSDSPSSPWTTAALTGPDVTSFTLGALAADTDYSFRVRAVNTTGRSTFSNIADATTPNAVRAEPPTTPSGVSAVGGAAGTIVVSWTDDANEGGYEVERATTPDGPFTIAGTTLADQTTFADAALAGGTTYSYRVRATGANGAENSAYSAIVSAAASEGGAGSPNGPSSGPTLPQFTVSILRARPAQPLPGARGRVNVRVDNGGQYPGTADVTLFASADEIIDATDIPLLSEPKSVFIRGANSKSLKLNFTYPITLPSGGDVRLLARAVNATGVSAVGSSDPLVVGGATAVTLSATELVSARSTIPRGGRGIAYVTILNTGNEDYRGLSTITLSASTNAAGGNDVILGAAAKKLSLRAGQARRIKVHYDIDEDTPAGAYTLVAKVEGSSTANGIIPAGSRLAGETVTVRA